MRGPKEGRGSPKTASSHLLARRRPWAPYFVIRFECADALAIIPGQCKIVPAVKQAHAPNGVDREFVGPIAAQDGLFFQIDRDRELGRLRQGLHDLRSVLIGDDRRKQSILHGIAGKDVAERRRDYAAHAEIVKRAASRDEPQPKFRALTTIVALRPAGLLSGKSAFSRPSESNRKS
jgi:hypothetical protein